MSPTKSVLHLINGEHYSGAERVQDLLALGLGDHGYRVAFACVKANRFPRVRLSRKTPLFEASMRGRCDLSILPRLFNLIRANDYDLLHAHTPRTAMLGGVLSAWTGIPLVYHVHSPAGRDSTRYWWNWLNLRLEDICLRAARHLITVSGSLGDYMQHLGVPADKISVVRNGVPSPIEIRSAVAPRDSWTLGTVALFRPRKGTEVLLEALAHLRAEGLPVRLKAIGGFEAPAYEDALKTRTEQLGLSAYVEWTGFTTDVAGAIRTLDAFVLPSLFGEGLPMVVLEAMAGGVPVVATSVEGVPEAITDGVHGLLARPQDAMGLADRIRALMKEPGLWSRIRESALRRHTDSFSDAAMCRGVAGVYDRVLVARTRGVHQAIPRANSHPPDTAAC